jgi:cleavage and polyadenylation specificity factor subunit 2
MMKSEGKTRVGFFKQAKKNYPMFPMSEERIRWDDYGEIIRPEDYMIIDSTPAEEEPVDVVRNRGAPVRKQSGGEETAQDLSEIPTKCISVKQRVDILANVVFIDFEGRSDGESIKKILTQIKPRQLILVHGTEAATKSLADYCKDVVSGKVLVPQMGEVVDATTESHIFQVKLKDSVVSALSFSRAEDAELAWIDAWIDLSKAKTDTSVMFESGDEHRKKAMDVDAEDEGTELVPQLMPMLSHQVPGHKAVFINEPKLSDFKQVLIREGIVAEFSGGVLICNNVVAVRRNEAGRMQLEGCICEDFYKVRTLLYSQYAIV